MQKKEILSINALLMNSSDNVVTCVREVKQGESIVYKQSNKLSTLIAQENIPYCHKAALADIPIGSDIIKYGESLGKTIAKIGKGCWVAEHNLISIPRDYASEILKL